MADVARLAEVSNQTVSRVLNHSAHVRADTRDRVLEAMRLLDYRPSSAARALVTGRSQMLGVISFDTTLYGPASTLFGIERAAHEAGYFVTVASLQSLDRDSVLGAAERLRLLGVDGLLVVAPQTAATHALANLDADVAVVAVEGGAGSPVPSVAVDQFGGGVAATEHLAALGHRVIGHLAGPVGWCEAEERVAGWRSVLDAAGLDVVPPLFGDWSPQSGYELGRELLDEPDITAVFAANDQMALGLLRVLHELGRDLPREISVVGFDDIPEAPFFTPPLTTVRQDFNEMGRRSLLLLLEEIDVATRSATHVTVAPELIVRSSTAPLDAGRPAVAAS
jgi:DNA-binding LacI/PurR family transcriptional regulator